MTSAPDTRVNLGKGLPAAYSAVAKMDAAAEEAAVASGFRPAFVELVRTRVSQLNGCAFCLRLHSQKALEGGEHADRMAVLSAWRETQYFSAQERAALALAEAVTLISDSARLAEAYRAAEAELTADQIAATSWVAIAINSFNRIAITSHYTVGP
jgi:AhpD family alkylhydroperoxidase